MSEWWKKLDTDDPEDFLEWVAITALGRIHRKNTWFCDHCIEKAKAAVAEQESSPEYRKVV